MYRIFALVLVLSVCSLGCNTLKGVQKDISNTASKIKDLIPFGKDKKN